MALKKAFWTRRSTTSTTLTRGLSIRPDTFALRRDLLTGAVLEELGDASNEVFVDLPGGRLALLLLRRVDLHVLEHRLYIPRDQAVPGGELRVEEETAIGCVEPTVGAEEIVHGRNADLFDA
jgi:hypothetical protein